MQSNEEIMVVCYRNIETLLNTYEKPDGFITYDNYTESVEQLNGTNNWKGEQIFIEDLNLDYCDLQSILSQVHTQGVFTGVFINICVSVVFNA